jgi:hypothetical protein
LPLVWGFAILRRPTVLPDGPGRVMGSTDKRAVKVS